MVKVIDVKPGLDYTLQVVLDNGKTGAFDVAPFLDKGIFKNYRIKITLKSHDARPLHLLAPRPGLLRRYDRSVAYHMTTCCSPVIIEFFCNRISMLQKN
jgi:hypothetical protein